jgi:hypothetical protein
MTKPSSNAAAFNASGARAQFKAATAGEFIDAMAARDPFFKGDRKMIEDSFRFNVWQGGPFVVVLPNQPFKDVPRNTEIQKMLHRCNAEIPPTHLCSGLLGHKDDMDNARMQYAFSNKAAAKWFAAKLEKEFGYETASFEMTDAGPNKTRIIYHTGPAR